MMFSGTNRAAILIRSLEKTNRIITGRRSVTVTMVPDHAQTAPAANNGRDVRIKARSMLDMSRRGLVGILGLNYHEVSHLLYTPRLSEQTGDPGHNKLMEVRASPRLQAAFNILEDQRIETLFVSKYRPASKYFAQMVVQYLLADSSNWDTAYPLLHGRRYLPLELRQHFKSVCNIDKALLRQIERVIDEYRTLDIVAHGYRAYELISHFAQLMSQASAPMDNSKCGGEKIVEMDEGQPESSKQEFQKAKEETEEQDEAEEDGEDGSGFWEDSDEDSEDDSDEDEEDGGGDDSDSDGDSDDEQSTGGSDDDEDDGTDEDDDADGEEGGGGGIGSTATISISEIEELLRDVRDEAEYSSDVDEEVKRVEEAMSDPRNFDFDPDPTSTVEVPVSQNAMVTASAMSAEFRRLYAQFDSGWHYGTDNGRLNIGRVMQGYDPDEVWDEWEPGNEQDTGLEIFIALDISGSMHKRIVEACESAWIIKKSAEELDAKVCVVGFGTGAVAVVSRTARASHASMFLVNRLHGSTQPYDAFKIAETVMNNSDMPNRLLVAVTDGGWQNGSYSHKYVYPEPTDILGRINATKMYVGIDTGYSTNKVAKDKYFDIAAEIKNPSDLIPLVQRAVTMLLNQHLNN